MYWPENNFKTWQHCTKIGNKGGGGASATAYYLVFVPSYIFAGRKSDLRRNEIQLWSSGKYLGKGTVQRDFFARFFHECVPSKSLTLYYKAF